jgi:PPOX class probable F420-dependent enzyme
VIEIDESSEFGRRVERRLREDRIGWLTTVDADGTPLPSPIWFLWEGGAILIYSRAGTPRLRNLARNGRVALNLDGDGRGGDIVVLTGDCATDPAAPPADANPAYVAKYAEGFRRLGMTAEEFSAAYPVAIRMIPTRLRGH